jgi:hypothetical protein
MTDCDFVYSKSRTRTVGLAIEDDNRTKTTPSKWFSAWRGNDDTWLVIDVLNWVGTIAHNDAGIGKGATKFLRRSDCARTDHAQLMTRAFFASPLRAELTTPKACGSGARRCHGKRTGT